MICRHLHGCDIKFESVTAIRVKLIDELGDQVPEKVDFNVGYYEGKQQAKIWLVSKEDLEMMYSNHSKGDIILWCDGRETRTKRKREKENHSVSARQEKEDEVDEVYKTLKEKHGSKYEVPKLRLWSRMICANLHDDTENPPNIPAFSSITPKKPRKDSLADAIEGAAVAFASVVSKGQTNDLCNEKTSCDHPLTLSTISPGKTVELRMKNYEQLRYLQSLFEDGILTDKEYSEQKENILSSLRKLPS